MSRLETPLKDVLRDVTTEASVARMWNRIEARGRVGKRGPLRGLASAHRLGLAAALLLLVVGVLAQRRKGPLPSVSAPAPAGPLALANGSPLIIAPVREHAAPLALSDGSTLVLEEGAAIEATENSATVVRLRQSRGNVLYDIKPGGPRRWTIEYGIVTVEVIGTSFRLEHAGPLLRIEVMRGTVLVRGEGVPGRAAQLYAGMKLEIADPPSLQPSAPPSAPSPADPPPAPSSQPSNPGSGPRPDVAVWRELAKRGENEEAYAELGSAGVARAARSASVDDLLTLADVARLSGHPADAVGPLERLVTEHSADSRASLAAFTLGRVHLDSLHAPAAAVRAFEKAIALGIPGGLAEDAYAHLVEARAKAGDEAGAKAALVEYVRRFPQGARRAELRRLVGVTTDPER